MSAVTVVGAGSIGVAWAIVFTRAGHDVTLYDPAPARLDVVGEELAARLAMLERAGLLSEAPAALIARLTVEPDLLRAAGRAEYVQECAPESLELKRRLFADLEDLVGDDCVLASSSSALMPTEIFADLRRPQRALVAHPANPPHLLPVVELVAGERTDPAVVARAEALLRDAGMSPVVVAREVEGFIFNRLQGAVLREAYALVRDGVADVEAVDRAVRDGLGRRWAVVGPFETSDLNTRGGIEAHAARMGPAYARMGAERGQDDPWTEPLVARVAQERRARLPLTRWEDRVAWRDEQLIAQEIARRAARPWPEPDGGAA